MTKMLQDISTFAVHVAIHGLQSSDIVMLIKIIIYCYLHW